MGKKKNKKQKWGVALCDGKIYLVKSKTKLLKVLSKLKINHDHYHEDRYFPNQKPGSAWENLWHRGFALVDFKVPEEFDLELIARCDNVVILDKKGNIINSEFVRITMKEKMIESAKTMAKAGGLGTKLAAAGRAQNAAYSKLTDLAEKQMGISKETMEDPKLKGFIQTIMPMAMHSMASMFEGQIPHAEKVKSVCELSMTEVSRDASEKFLGVAFEMITVMADADNPVASLRVEETATEAVQQDAEVEVLSEENAKSSVTV